MRALLRRLLMEDSEDNWTDAELNALLNLSLQSWQDYILVVQPEAFLQWDYADITSGERFYPKPVGMRYEIELGVKSTAAATDYAPLTVHSYDAIRHGVVGTRRESDIDPIPTEPNQLYAHAGKYFFLGWAPSDTISQGLECCYVQHLTMGADSDVPDLAIGLHYGVVLEGAIMALRETPEDTARLEKDRDRLVDKIALYYRKSAAGPSQVHPMFGKKRY